jgi:transposase IS4-like protein/DDE family transposase
MLSQARLGVLARLIPPELVDEALAVSDRDEQRWRALPARLGVYFVLALCLLRTKSAPAVLQNMFMTSMLARLRERGWSLPSSTALSKLRDRIGAVPLQLLFGALAQWRPVPRQAWSHAFGLLVCAWDGTEIPLADTADNREHFRRHRSKTGSPAGVPKTRLLVLLACGSRQLLGAATGTLARGEVTLAHELIGRLRPGMLLLADRNFLGHRLWTAARTQGTHLLWRAKSTKPLLPAQQVLPDGSWHSTLYDPADIRAWRHTIARNRKRGHNPPRPRPLKGITVRVIEALITVTIDGVTRTEKYRLVTSLLDPQHAPADQLVALYARRWIAETGIREIKTVLLAGRALRGHTPVRALQELWATLIIYQTIRLLISQTALTTSLDPSRISFTAARDTVEHAITTTPADTEDCLDWIHYHLSQQLITHHHHTRVFPRALKNTLTRYPHRGKTRQLTSNKASYQVHLTPATTAQPRTA